MTDETPWRRRSRRALRLSIVLAELAFGAVCLAALALVYAVTTPDVLRPIVDHATADAPFDLSFEDVEVLPTSQLLAPSTWRLAFLGIRVEPRNDHAPVITIDRVHVGMPYLGRLLFDRELQLRSARVIGLHVAARQQRPGPPWEPKQPAIAVLGADRVEIWGASFHAPEDEPLQEAQADRIFGELFDLAYQPGPRLLSASGTLRIASFRSGSLEVENIVLPAVTIDDSTLWLDGRLVFAGARGRVRGEIKDFTRKTRTVLEVELTGARIEDAVERATGHKSPLVGNVDAYLVVTSGGDIPRGHGRMEGSIRLVNGRIPLGNDIKPFIKDLIRLAPYLVLNEQDEVELGPMHGKMQVRRGSIILEELLYEAPRRHIQFRGEMVDANKYLVIRFMPARDPALRPGFGVVLAGRERLRFRLADKHDLLPDRFPREGPAQATGIQLFSSSKSKQSSRRKRKRQDR